MAEIKWDVKRGAQIYGSVYDARLKNWILTGKIKPGEVVVWRSGFSGWRKPEELEELALFFERWGRHQLKEVKRKKRTQLLLPTKKQIKNILVIDDEKDLCSLLQDSLSSRKFKVAIANTKREAVNYLRKERPDCVFLDLKLPDGDGIKLLPQIKKLNPTTIVNIITAYGSEESREEARKMGAYAFIDKPFKERDILGSLTESGR